MRSIVTKETESDRSDPIDGAATGIATDKGTGTGRSTVRSGSAIKLGPLGANIGFHLRLASIEAERALRERAGESLRLGYFPVLMLIRLNPDATQTAIAEAVGLRRSSLVPILKQLERFGWIERSENEGDKRAKRIRLTTAGMKASDAINSEVERIEDAARDSLGHDGHRRVVELLRELETLFRALAR